MGDEQVQIITRAISRVERHLRSKYQLVLSLARRSRHFGAPSSRCWDRGLKHVAEDEHAADIIVILQHGGRLCDVCDIEADGELPCFDLREGLRRGILQWYCGVHSYH